MAAHDPIATHVQAGHEIKVGAQRAIIRPAPAHPALFPSEVTEFGSVTDDKGTRLLAARRAKSKPRQAPTVFALDVLCRAHQGR